MIKSNPFLGLACSVLIGLSTVTTKADYPATVLANNPVVYWRLNENAQVPAADVAKNSGSLGTSVDGYYVGTAAHPTAGALAAGSDTAATFDGTAGSIVSVPYSAALNPSGAFTVEAWLNPGAELGAGGLTAALASGQFASPRSGWLLYQSDTGWSFRMYNQNGTATSLNLNGNNGSPPVAGTWYHIVVAYDGTTAKMYINGAEVASGAPAGTPTFVPSKGGPLYIGGRSDNSFWWNGSADEVAIYGTALSPATITGHYQNGTNAAPATGYDQLVAASTPLAYYRLDEPAYTPATGPTAVNAGTSGTANDGTYNPGVNDQAAGPRPPTYSGFTAANTAAGLNGNAGYVGTPYTMNDLTEFTMMGWIKRGANHSSRGGYFGQNDLLEFGDADNGANVEVWVNAFGTNIKIPYPFPDDQWGLMAITGNATEATLYTNGVAALTITHAAIDSYGSSTYNFNIGGGGIFNATGDFFLGSVDEVAVFDKALTAAQIQDLYFAAGISPIITQQPAAPVRSLQVGNYTTLSVTAAGTPTLTYHWRKGGQDIPGKTSSTLTFNGLTANDAGSYDVVVTNPYGSATSNPVTLTVGPADSIAPILQYADSNSSSNSVRLWFSEPLDPTSAQNIANYQISDGTSTLAITSATLAAAAGSAGDNMVDLATAVQTPGKTYTVTVNNVKDQTSPGNTIAANSKVTFTAWKLATGYLTFEHYDNIQGAADSDIDKSLQDPRVIAHTPTTAGFLTGRFDTRTIFPDDSHEFYFARMTGYIVPTETDDYYFFLRSDDAGRFYLSPTEAIPNPATDTPTAIETGCCGAFMEPGTDDATTATAIHLEAGKRYGVLALLKEHGGGDYLQIAWRKASDTTAAASLQPIPGQFLATYVDPNTDLTITTQPTDQPGVLPSPVVDFVTKNFATDDGGFTVIDTTPPPPGPFLYDPTAQAWVAQGSEDACTGPYNSKLTSPAFTVPVSDEVTMTFSHRYSFEADRWDGGQIWISVNGGAFTPVSPDSFTANGYPPGLIQGSGVLLNQRAFHDDSPGYANGDFITTSLNLGRFAKNDTIAVQFVGAWDDCSSGSHPSWVIKNMSMAYGTAPRASTFTAAATATKQGATVPFTYQWQRDDGTGFVDIVGENNATLRIFPTQADFNARFRVVVKVAGNEVTSNVVKLTGGTSTPTLAIAKSATGATITFTGRLQSSATVNGTYTDVSGATSPYNVPTGSGTVFYRSAQ